MGRAESSSSKNSVRILLSLPANRPVKRGTPINTVEALNDTGLGYVAAACKRAGAAVALLSWNVNLDMEAFRRKLVELRPDIVGLKVFTTMFRESYETLRCVREALPEAITLIGGPHPSTSRPEDLFVEYDGLLDFAIAGDGEYGVASLIDQIRIAGGKPDVATLSVVPGLIYRNGDEVHLNKLCLDADLDTLAPMDWSVQQPAWFGTSHGVDNVSIGALIMDSRGCPARCAYCLSHKINGSNPRHRSLELLCAEIKEITHKYGVRALIFTGNAFLSDVDYVRELSEWLIQQDIPLKWSFTGAAYERNLLDTKLLSLLRRAGCTLIYFGIESGSSNVRKRLNQPLALEEYAEIVKLTVQTGIRAGGYFMFGFPDETTHEMNETIKYALSLPFEPLSFAVCLPLPGTSSYRAVLEQEGIDRIDWSTYDFAYPKLLPCEASPAQVHRKIFETKLLRKSSFIRRLHKLLY